MWVEFNSMCEVQHPLVSHSPACFKFCGSNCYQETLIFWSSNMFHSRLGGCHGNNSLKFVEMLLEMHDWSMLFDILTSVRRQRNKSCWRYSLWHLYLQQNQVLHSLVSDPQAAGCSSLEVGIFLCLAKCGARLGVTLTCWVDMFVASSQTNEPLVEHLHAENWKSAKACWEAQLCVVTPLLGPFWHCNWLGIFIEVSKDLTLQLWLLAGFDHWGVYESKWLLVVPTHSHLAGSKWS